METHNRARLSIAVVKDIGGRGTVPQALTMFSMLGKLPLDFHLNCAHMENTDKRIHLGASVVSVQNLG